MYRQSTMWTLLCATVPFACPQEPAMPGPIPSDTLEYSVSPEFLNEIVVTASPVINKTDRKIIRPAEEVLRSAANGVDLLRKLQLAGISVNPLTNDIATSGGGTVVLCINGVESTSAQISAIIPSDIILCRFAGNWRGQRLGDIVRSQITLNNFKETRHE